MSPSELRADGETRPLPELVLAQLDDLPALAPVAARLIDAAQRGAAPTELAPLLRGEPAAAAALIALAGAGTAPGEAARLSLATAVSRLGTSATRNAVLALKLSGQFATTERPGAFEPREYWRHALAVAAAARRLAQARPMLSVDPEDAFAAGLLHDLGKLALRTVFPRAYERAVLQTEHSRGDIADAERSVLGVDHTIAGRRLAERWKLPRPLRDAIWLHHLGPEALPASVSNAVLVGVVELADVLARQQGVGYSGNHKFYEPLEERAARLGFDPESLPAIAAELAPDVARYEDALQLDALLAGGQRPAALHLANAELAQVNEELWTDNRRLAAAARYFQALARADAQLDAWSDVSAVVAALADAGRIALQCERVCAFGLYRGDAALDACWSDGGAAVLGYGVRSLPRGRAVTIEVAPELAEWLRDPGGYVDRLVLRLPAVLRPVLRLGGAPAERGVPWLAPIVHAGRLCGGLIYFSEADEHARLAGEVVELRSFLTSLSLALGRANAQAAALQLSDDLAETNRRLQQMQLELLRSRTLSMIAEMSAGAGHELNSPLAVISGRAQMLRDQVENPEMRRALEVIHAKAHECSRIVTELMDFARPRAPQIAAVDVAALLEQWHGDWLSESGLGANRLTVDSERNLPRVAADAAQLRVVLWELIRNAVAAVGGNGGTIHVRARVTGAGDSVELHVRDTGCGMSAQVLQRAFDPFYSHRDAGRGRGLGLPRAYRIIEAHRGRIWLESRPAEGTSAFVVLPTAGAALNRE